MKETKNKKPNNTKKIIILFLSRKGHIACNLSKTITKPINKNIERNDRILSALGTSQKTLRIEKYSGVVFEFWQLDMAKLPDYMNLLREFYEKKVKVQVMNNEGRNLNMRVNWYDNIIWMI